MRLRHIVFGLLVLLPMGLYAKKTDLAPDSVSTYMLLAGQADSLIAAGDYGGAIDKIVQAMRAEPSNPGNLLLLSNQGMLYYYIGNDSLALECLNQAHEMAPASVTVLLNRARVNHGIGNYSRALADYDRATQLDSTLVDAWIQKGLLQLRGGDVRGAEASIEEAEKLESKLKEVAVSKAILYSKTNRPAEALPYLNLLIKKDPQPEYYAERAICRLRTDDLGGAAEDIVDGLQLDRNYADLYVARALLNRRRYREKDAKADIQRAVEEGASVEYIKALGFKL